MGGCSSAGQFQDIYSLDTDVEPHTWSKMHSTMPSPTWNFSTTAVLAIPTWKIFTFGGVTGKLSDADRRGKLQDSMMIFDTGINRFLFPKIEGTIPSPRSDAALAFDSKGSRLLVFGGWSEKWQSDLYTIDVSNIVGPPYAVLGMNPNMGPVTGGTDVKISGIDFTNTTDVLVRFGLVGKQHVDVPGTYESKTTISCTSPDYTKFPAGEVDVRVALGGDTFTTTCAKFTYFTVTNADTCIIYGPGVLSGCATNEEVSFIIQARDDARSYRTTGGDEFDVTVDYVGTGSGDSMRLQGVSIQDLFDGRYVVTYLAKHPGKYTVGVHFLGTFGGTAGPIKGSGVVVEFSVTAQRECNSLTGSLVMQALKNDIEYLQRFTQEISSSIFVRVKDESWSSEEQIRVLMNVKEALLRADTQAKDINLLVDRAECVLMFLNEQEVPISGSEDALASGKALWERIVRESNQVLSKIAPIMRAHAGKIRGDILSYEAHVLAYKEELQNAEYYKFVTGPVRSKELLGNADAMHLQQKAICEKMKHIANVFDCVKDMDGPIAIITEVGELLADFRVLWDSYEHVTDLIGQVKSVLWSKLNAESLEDTARDLTSTVRKLPKSIRGTDSFAGFEKLVKDFVVSCPIIVSLRSPAMRERHWKDLMKVIKTDFMLPAENPDMRLRNLMDMNLHQFGEGVDEITDKAQKEAKHEETLFELEASWADINFSTATYKDTEVQLVHLEENLVEQLEADQMAVQSIVASRYTHFKQDALEWQRVLNSVSEIVALLLDLQRTWSYLEPLFIGSEEVKRELPQDAAKFEQVDTEVKAILKKATFQKQVKMTCEEPGLLKKLQDIEKKQEACKKKLSEYLDSKRRQFPRFYFMSEADLLDLLSNSAEPAKVLAQVEKVMLSTRHLTLESQYINKTTLEWRATRFTASVGDEVVAFLPPVFITGKVETYLTLIVKAQQATLSQCLRDCADRYPDMTRLEWLMSKDAEGVTKDPAQLAYLVAQIDFVTSTERALRERTDGNDSSIKRATDDCLIQLSDLINASQAPMTKGDRQRITCMITLDAHSRDILEELQDMRYAKEDDFVWQSKLRPRLTTLPPPLVAPGSAGGDPYISTSAEFKICDASFNYGFEYLGNGSRLVLTPLSDRMYVTATQALNLKMGCAPAGPAGTGKTETTKDLAMALGKCCYVFNCTAEMDYKSVGNIFRGLAASGSWGCFDEFNRLVPEVLSVCSVQVKALCDALRGYNPKANASPSVTIEGDKVHLDPTCGTFTTVTPGYLGRSELPEGLKAHFRPITFIVPDLLLICENMLMAEGFFNARPLASKFSTLYSHLDELLSKQEHYDWGLRAVKSVLNVAGLLKRANPELDEDLIIMRALRDFNVPKLVAADEVVFFGLLNDLFPDLAPKRQFDEELRDFVSTACDESGMWADPYFNLKVLQLDEMMDIRHSAFVIGPPGVGKSAIWKTLQAAKGLQAPHSKVKSVVLNPKVVPTALLYGYINMKDREWKDGVLSSIMRDLGRIPNDSPKWIILDGDVDANWAESMNSVMDDNKTLTLASNERIPLKPHMRLIFEVKDLQHVTPATVSRGGVLYVSLEHGSQWRAVVGSWVRSRPDDLFDDADRERLHRIFERYFADTLKYFAGSLKGVVYVNDVSLCMAVLRNLEAMLTRPVVVDESSLEAVFVFCFVWGLGSSLTVAGDGVDYLKMFNDWFRSKYKTVKIPSRDTVFDYWLDIRTNKFESWKNSPAFKTIEFDSEVMSMANIMVPTSETASVSFWAQTLVKNGFNVMLAGFTGTGKTALISGMLANLKPESHLSATVNMNYYTSAQSLMTSFEARLMKRTGSTFGPPGMGRMVFFLDDMNLPEVDAYGTQTAMGLLRQHIDYGAWYDLQKLSLKTIDDCQYVGALNPSVGSFSIDSRLQRHFTTFAVALPNPTSLLTIYQTFLDGHMKSRYFSPAVSALTSALIKASLAIHKEVTETFRKSVQYFHYEFNIRHLAGVFQGLLMSDPGCFSEPEKFVFLWVHECERVYGDRLVEATHVAQFKTLIQSQAKKAFVQYNVSRFFLAGAGVKPDYLIFCHFADGTTQADDLTYDRGISMTDLRYTLDQAIEDYNDSFANMSLVMFDDAIMHVCRIVRIIKQVGGHALLVGAGSSGKQSLAKLAGWVCGYEIQQIGSGRDYGPVEFKKDLQGMFNNCGIKQEGVLLLVNDSRVTTEKFFVQVNDLLSCGNIPDLFSNDELDAIRSNPKVLNKAKKEGYGSDPASVWKYYLSKIRQYFHVALCFSPGPSFRTRAKRFPAIANCTVIDWFQPWPEQALASVGSKVISKAKVGDAEVVKAVEAFLPSSFTALGRMCKSYHAAEGKQVYTTPKSFFEMLALFQTLLTKRRTENEEHQERLKLGVEKLNKAAADVAYLDVSLQSASTVFEEKRGIAEGIYKAVAREQALVDEENAKADVEKKKIMEITQEVAGMQAEAARDMRAAEPSLQRAGASLETLDKRDLGNIKTMNKAPPGVEDVFGAIMVLFAGVNPHIFVQKNGRVREKERNWDAAKKALLSNVNSFLDDLRSFKMNIDEGTVPEVNWKEARPFLMLEHFQPDVIEKRNPAAGCLCAWVINIVEYYDVVQLLEPKRLALKGANDQLAKTNAALSAISSKMVDLQSKLDVLMVSYNTADAQRKDAEELAVKGQLKLDLAQRLLKSLGSDIGRWKITIDRLSVHKAYIVGDCLLAATFISYLGPFPLRYRYAFLAESVLPLFRQPAVGAAIALTPDIPPLSIVCNESELAQCRTEGLPADQFSAENAIILMNSTRHPLLIDPQLQALAWIKKRSGKKLETGRMGSEDLMSALMEAVEEGKPFIIESMGEEIDPILLPVIFRVGKKDGKKFNLCIGDDEVEVHKNYKLYLHTKLPNPHYPPEVQAECTMINFSVERDGLEEQLLAMTVRLERAELAAETAALTLQENLFTIRTKELEDNILERLSSSPGDVAEDGELIEELEYCKKMSDDIGIKLKDNRSAAGKLSEVADKYRPVAKRGAVLFFVMESLKKIHPYYVYTLSSFMDFYAVGVKQTEKVFSAVVEAPSIGLGRGIAGSMQAKGKDILKGRIAGFTANQGSPGGGDNSEVPSQPSSPRMDVSSPGTPMSGRSSMHDSKLGEESGKPPEDFFAQLKAIDVPGNVEKNLKTLEEFIKKRSAEVIIKNIENRGLNMVDRVVSLKLNISNVLYDFVRASLFDRDKLTVAAMFTFKAMVEEGELEQMYVDVITRGREAEDVPSPGDEVYKWCSETAWARVKAIEEDLERSETIYESLTEKIATDVELWEEWYNSAHPETVDLPNEFRVLAPVPKLMLLRVLRPDRLSYGLVNYIKEKMGSKFAYQPPFTMDHAMQHTASRTPILFVLLPGVYPTAWVEEYGTRMGCTAVVGKFLNLSMGQGQEKTAEQAIKKMNSAGGWVFLQNIHLMTAWMPKLVEILDTLEPHDGFRMFLSTEAPPPSLSETRHCNLPEALLQLCHIVTNEPASDLKSNMMRAWKTFSQGRLDASKKKINFKACLFGLCFFHSALLGRKRYGTLGWSQAYGFNTGDLNICANVLDSYLNNDRQHLVPWDDMRYIFGEIMYGGHITDFFDRRINHSYLINILTDGLMRGAEICPKLLSPDPQDLNFESYENIIARQLPAESPLNYGLHPNAELRIMTDETEYLFRTMYALESGATAVHGGTAGGTGDGVASSTDRVGEDERGQERGQNGGPLLREMSIADTVQEMLKRIPRGFDMKDLEERCSPKVLDADGPYAVVVMQECARMNILLSEMTLSLTELLKGVNGLLSISQASEDLQECLGTNTVPGRSPLHSLSWERFAWSSRKSFNAWFLDMGARHHQLFLWSHTLHLPYSIWLPGLINPISLLTAIKQVTARACKVPLDSLTLDTHVTKMYRLADAVTLGIYPENGILVHGLFIEGARWSDDSEGGSSSYQLGGVTCAGSLMESKPKQLVTAMPVMYVKASEVQDGWTWDCVGYLRNEEDTYECPVYNTSARGSTFVFLSTLKIAAGHPAAKWILAGVALLMQTDT